MLSGWSPYQEWKAGRGKNHDVYLFSAWKMNNRETYNENKRLLRKTKYHPA